MLCTHTRGLSGIGVSEIGIPDWCPLPNATEHREMVAEEVTLEDEQEA